MHKNLWLAGSGGRSFFFIETVQLAQRHPWVIDVHDQLKKPGCPCLNPQNWATKLSSNEFPCCPQACLPPLLGSMPDCWPLLIQCSLWSTTCVSYPWIKLAQSFALFALLFRLFFFRHWSLLNFNLPRRD